MVLPGAIPYAIQHALKYPILKLCHDAPHLHSYACGKSLCIVVSIPLRVRHESYASVKTFLDNSSLNYASMNASSDDPYLKYSCVSSWIEKMVQTVTHVDVALYGDLLQWSGDSKAPLVGILTHDHIIRYHWEDNTSLVNLLVKMYVKYGKLEDATALFMKTDQRSASLWNFLVRAHATQGDDHKAFKLLEQMQLEKAMPSKSTFVRLLSTCLSKADLDKGKKLHKCIKSSRFESDVFVRTALVSMYGKCGSLEDAWETFKEMLQKDVVSYTVMIGVYAQYGRGIEAIQLLNKMEDEGFKPDKVTFVCVLNACSSCSLLDEGEKLHIYIKQSGVELDVVVATALINMYGKCGSVEAARKIFDKMPQRNVISWNTMLSVYAQHNQVKEAIKILDQMRHDNVKPDRVTFVSIVDACATHALLSEGERMHGLILDNGLEGDAVLGNALVNMYGKCGSLKKARAVFNQMLNRNVVSWNTMIAVHAQHGQGKAALELLNQMQQEGVIPDSVTFVCIFDACASCSALLDGKRLQSCMVKSKLELDVVVGTTLVNMYGKCGNLKEARMMYNRMLEKNVVSWNTMFSLYVHHDQGKDAFELFAQMQVEGVKPDKITFSCIIDACARSSALAEGEKVHLLVMDAGYQMDTVLGTALVYMYGKCGSLKDAVRVFDRISGQDIVSWTAMIAVYAQHGQANEALNLFYQMQGEGGKPDDVTLVSILTACSHSGLLDEAYYCFASMILNHAISPATEHYVCMIDLLGKAGCLNEAEIIIHCMPAADNSAAWFLSFLGACRYHIDVERGERAAKHLFEMDVDGISPYITLSNIYAAAGRASQAAT